MIQASGTITAPFTCTETPTGTPIYVLVKNGTDTATTGNCSGSGTQWYASATVPSNAAIGEQFWFRVSAVISGTTYSANTQVETVGVFQTGDSFSQIGSAGAGLTAIGDTRLANLDMTISEVHGDVQSIYLIVSNFADVDGNSDTVFRGWMGLASANLDTQLGTITERTGNLPDTPAAVGSAMTLTSAYDAAKTAASQASVDAVKTDTGNLVNRITSTLFSGMTSLGRWLGLLAGKTADSTTLAEINATTAGATYSNVTDSLEAIRDRGDTSWSSGGSGLTGANLVTITVDDGSDPVPGAYVRLKAGAETEVKRTDADGEVTFTTDDNTFSVRITATGLTFEDVSLAVTADTTVTYSMTPVATSTDSWATGEDLVAYYDATTIGQMLKDDRTTVQAADVPNHPVVNRILLLSTGEVNSALMQSNRYSQDQLESMGASSVEHLKNITCAVAMWHLGERRINNNPERQEAARKLAELHLERLRKGELVLDVAVNRDAGVAQNVAYVQPGSSQNYPLLRDRMSGVAGHFPKKLFPGS